MTKERVLSFIEEVSDEELDQIVGAGEGYGCGWLCTLTDDCPNSIIVCC